MDILLAKIKDVYNEEAWCRVLWVDEKNNVVVEHYGKHLAVPYQRILEFDESFLNIPEFDGQS